MTAPDKATLRFAHTALVMSYSVALSGSVGFVLGSGEVSSTRDPSSESELYSESPSDSDSLDDSVEEMESAVGVEPADDEGRGVVNDTLPRLSFFLTGSRARFQGPVPFSGK